MGPITCRHALHGRLPLPGAMGLPALRVLALVPSRANAASTGRAPPDRVIGFGDPQACSFPRLRWSVCHTSQLMPTRAVSRGLGPMSWRPAFDANFTDGVVVLHRGAVV
jgi:hypothetical protein